MTTTLDLEKMTTAAKLQLMEELWQNLSAEKDELVARAAAPDPAVPDDAAEVNWNESPAITRDRTGEIMLTAEESTNLIHDAASKW